MPIAMNARFDDAGGDVAERERLVLPLEDREQHDGACRRWRRSGSSPGALPIATRLSAPGPMMKRTSSSTGV